MPGDTLPVVRVRGVDVALAICEDLWQDGGRVPAARSAGAGLLLSVNASRTSGTRTTPAGAGPQARPGGRLLTPTWRSDRGQDELVFDGDTIVVDGNGEVIARAPQFAEGSVVLDLDLPAATAEPVEGVVDDGMRVERVVLSESRCPRTSRS